MNGYGYMNHTEARFYESPIDPDDDEIASTLGNYPGGFADKQGRVYLSLTRFASFVGKLYNGLKRQDVIDALKGLGFKSEKISKRCGGVLVQPRLWASPPSFLYTLREETENTRAGGNSGNSVNT